MDEENKNQFLKDFKKADIEKKLDMWYYAVDQSGIWEELIEEMSTIAEEQKMSQVVSQMKKTRDK
jgi:hypothetical protein